MRLTVNCIFDWPEQIQTSPNKTSWSVIVTSVPLANGCETWISNGPSSETGSSVTDQILSFCAFAASDSPIAVYILSFVFRIVLVVIQHDLGDNWQSVVPHYLKSI